MKRKGFTLIELLVVIAIIAVLMGILMPALSRARELGKRAVCLSNVKQLQFAWVMYADDNSQKIVNGECGFDRPDEPAWLDKVFDDNYGAGVVLPELQQIAAIKSGAIWSYLPNLDSYQCPTGRRGELVTYMCVDAANGRTGGRNVMNGNVSKRVGKTILWLKKTTDIVAPAPAKRMIFIDEGWATPDSFATHYTQAQWWDDPPSRHGAGTVVSFADGHTEHLKWRSSETIKHSKEVEATHANNWTPTQFEAKVELYDFQELVWGRVGYSKPSKPLQ